MISPPAVRAEVTSNPSHYVRNKRIVFICAGTDQTKDRNYENMKSWGVRVVLIDNYGSSLARRLQDTGVVEKLIELDFTSKTLLEDAINELRKLSMTLDAITTIWDDAVPLAAQLAEHYGFPFTSSKTVECCRRKNAAREFLRDKGYASPLSFTLSSLDEANNCRSIPGALIMKPVIGAASIGVRRLESAESIGRNYEEVVSEIEGQYALGELMGVLIDDDTDKKRVVVEQYLEGPEFDVDVAVSAGEIVYCNLVDDWPYEAPHFCEIGSNCPTSRHKDVAGPVEAFARRVVVELGLDDGVFHIEVINDRQLGPVLIEVNVRMGGGPIRAIHKRVFQIDLLQLVCFTALGVRLKPIDVVPARGTAVSVNLFAKTSGILTSHVEKCGKFLIGNDHLVNADFAGEAGQSVTGWNEGYPTHMGRINCYMEGMDSKAAIMKAKEYLSEFDTQCSSITEKFIKSLS